MKAHAKTVQDVLEKFETDKDGLTQNSIRERLEEYGKNTIDENQRPSVIAILLSQFQSYLIYILFAAVIFSLAVGFFPGEEPRYQEATIILVILISNGLLGFYQDYRAEQAIDALQSHAVPDATVIRNGQKKTIDPVEIVPGDIIVLEQGDAVPADARLLEVESVATEEAALTGESMQVNKQVEPIDEDKQVADQSNMVFKGTNVVRGRARGVAVSTGMETQIGKIAHELQSTEDEKTPFQREIDDLGRRLGQLITGFVLVISVIQGVATGTDTVTLILLAIGLLVAAIPESLPVVVTFALARGSRRMMEQNALVRRLPVVESLGSVNYIVTDKTGTLTQGTMTVRQLYYNGETITVPEDGTNSNESFRKKDETINSDVVAELLRCGLYCNNTDKVDGGYDGDPTEIALYVAAEKAGLKPQYDREREIPFSADRKRMTTVMDDGQAYMKGAPETILNRCNRIIKDGEIRELTETRAEEVTRQVNEYAEDAMRVLGFARREVNDLNINENELEQEMIFLGLQAMIDPPREEVNQAVQDCRNAGIRVIMATGDDRTTASAVGDELGFSPENTITGQTIEKMDEEELKDKVHKTEIFARVSPKHKVSLLGVLKDQGYEVAMTGDGVNDAPALKDSDVGISMGQNGTDVAKQSSDIVLQDDNFVTIRDAIKEGRTIFDNIRKVTNYLLSTNAAEVMFVFLGAIVAATFFQEAFDAQHADTVVLTAVMILWVNFSTDGPPSIAMASDKSVPGVMDREPRQPGEPIIDSRMISMIAMTGPLAALIYLPLFFFHVDDFQLAQTNLFTGLSVFELIMVQIIRREYKLSLLKNFWLILSLALAFIAQLTILYTPLATWFGVLPLEFSHWLEQCLAGVVFITAIVGYQLILFRFFGPRRGAKST